MNLQSALFSFMQHCFSVFCAQHGVFLRLLDSPSIGILLHPVFLLSYGVSRPIWLCFACVFAAGKQAFAYIFPLLQRGFYNPSTVFLGGFRA